MELLAKEFISTSDKQLKSCHASTVVALPNEEIMAAWFAGTKEGDKGVDIWCSRRSQGKWSVPFRVVGENGVPQGIPYFSIEIIMYYIYFTKWVILFRIGTQW